MTVRVAHAAEFEGGYAWGVVRELFQPEVRAGGHGLAGDAAALAAPALGHAGPAGEEDSFSVVHGLYWLTAGMAQQAPLLLAVDDLHWADQPSLRFIAHLARRLDGLPVLLVTTVREPRSATAQDRALTAGLAAEPGGDGAPPGRVEPCRVRRPGPRGAGRRPVRGLPGRLPRTHRRQSAAA